MKIGRSKKIWCDVKYRVFNGNCHYVYSRLSRLSLSLGTTKMVNHFLQKVYKLRSKTKVHMKVDHGVRALGYVAFKKIFSLIG